MRMIGLLVHVRRCAQRLYILTTSEDSRGRESLAPLFWGVWEPLVYRTNCALHPERFGVIWSRCDDAREHLRSGCGPRSVWSRLGRRRRWVCRHGCKCSRWASLSCPAASEAWTQPCASSPSSGPTSAPCWEQTRTITSTQIRHTTLVHIFTFKTFL